MALTIQNIGADCCGVEILRHRRQPFIMDRRYHRIARGAIKSFSHGDIIHVIIFDSRRQQLTDNLRE